MESGLKRRLGSYAAEILRVLYGWYHRPYLARVPLDRLLLGGENACSAGLYARSTGDLMRPSTPVGRSPHLQLLREYERRGPVLLEPEEFRRTAYFANAMLCVDIFGRYFDARDEAGVREVAADFIARYQGRDPRGPLREGQTGPGTPIRVRPIAESDCFEVVDGHHRLAIAEVRGEREVTVRVEGPAAHTPLQLLLHDSWWRDPRRELRQPIDAPELRGVRVRRRCADRLRAMKALLAGEGLIPGGGARYLDVGSRYGWFVAEMGRLGFDAYGIERDPTARAVGLVAYGIPEERVARADCVRFLRADDRVFDVVSALGVIHRFSAEGSGAGGEDLFHLLDRHTGRVLFLEVEDRDSAGAAGSAEGSPEGWGAERVEEWFRERGTFSRILCIGRGADGAGAGDSAGAYTLLACIR